MNDKLQRDLVVGKRLLDDAWSQLRRGDEAARIQALILAYAAFELTLKSVALHTSSKCRVGHAPGRLVHTLTDAGLEIDQTAFEALRLARNGAVHGDDVPDADAAEEYLHRADLLVRSLFACVDRDLDDLLELELLRNPLVRDPLRAALAAAEDPSEAAESLARAWFNARGLLQEALAGASGVAVWVFESPMWHPRQVESECGDGQHKHLRASLQIAAAMQLTSDLTGLARLRGILRLGGRTGLDDEAAGDGIGPPSCAEGTPSPGDIVWATAFVARCWYRLESIDPGMRTEVRAPRSGRPDVAAFLPNRVMEPGP